MAVTRKGCACARTCGGRTCGHRNSLGAARRPGPCQSLKLPEVGEVVLVVLDGGIWCSGAWSRVHLPAVHCNALGEQLLHELSTDAGSLDHVSLGCCEDDIVKQLLMRLQEGGVISFLVHNHHIPLLCSSRFDLEHNKWKYKNRQVEYE